VKIDAPSLRSLTASSLSSQVEKSAHMEHETGGASGGVLSFRCSACLFFPSPLSKKEIEGRKPEVGGEHMHGILAQGRCARPWSHSPCLKGRSVKGWFSNRQKREPLLGDSVSLLPLLEKKKKNQREGRVLPLRILLPSSLSSHTKKKKHGGYKRQAT